MASTIFETPMDWEYNDLKEEPWPFIESMSVDIYYASPHDMDAGWHERKTITKQDLMQWSAEFSAAFCIYAPWREEPNVFLEIIADKHHGLLISATVHKVHCKAGITLKSPFDITELFFEDYNPPLIDEWERKSYYLFGLS